MKWKTLISIALLGFTLGTLIGSFLTGFIIIHTINY